MNDPIPIRDERDKNPELTPDQYLRWLKERNDRRIQWAFLTFVGVIVMGFFVPLIVFLTRLALGG